MMTLLLNVLYLGFLDNQITHFLLTNIFYTTHSTFIHKRLIRTIILSSYVIWLSLKIAY